VSKGSDDSFDIRPARDDEWQACRMLLPETFADVNGREYFLCTRQHAPRIVAAASCRRTPESVNSLRVHVIPPFRRRGIGARMIDHMCGDLPAAEGLSEITKERNAEPFCAGTGFVRVDGLTTVEADVAEIRVYIGRLRDRIQVPEGARLISLSEAPIEQVARLHAEYIAGAGQLNPWRAVIAGNRGLARSVILLVDGSVEGILLWELEASIAIVRSRVVTARFQAGWANMLLLAEALDRGWECGARRVQFSYSDSNRDTQRLARRFKAEVISVLAKFQRGGLAIGAREPARI
jgi:GNAT superfamily N-acetyltransferase